uniref:Uncharacterized protein n=1 Tax=viral metagenome TaxID=1070528 RepID=A0A6H1ZHB3_9ZZZZ
MTIEEKVAAFIKAYVDGSNGWESAERLQHDGNRFDFSVKYLKTILENYHKELEKEELCLKEEM